MSGSEGVLFARSVRKGLRDEVQRARRRVLSSERAEQLARWAGTRGTSNQYLWQPRYERVDGVLVVVHPDGSRTPSRQDPVALLNQQAQELERAEFHKGVLHAMLGVTESVAWGLERLRERGADALTTDDVGRPQPLTEWILDRTRYGVRALEAERLRMRGPVLDRAG